MTCLLNKRPYVLKHFATITLFILVNSCAKKTQVPTVTEVRKTEIKAAAQVHTSLALFNGGNESLYYSFRISPIIKWRYRTPNAFITDNDFLFFKNDYCL